MNTNLTGRIALVTGSSSGLGKAIAEKLAMEGADLIINGKDKKKLNQTALEIGFKSNTNIHNCCIDDANPKEIEKFFSQQAFWLKKIDILINNVGNIETFGKFENLSDEDWQRSFELTFMSAVRFIRASLPYLKKSDQARIINISSLSAHQPSFTGLNPHYGMAKAGLVNLTKNLANDFGRYGITVNTICPSTLAGGGWHKNIRDRSAREMITAEQAEEKMRNEENRKSPLNKMGGPYDLANLVVFLASSSGKFLTGHCYNVDGGITRSIL